MIDERVKAIVTIIVTAAVNIANVYGYAVNAEPIITTVLSIFSAVMIIYSWWKNQNITDSAIKAQAFLDNLKAKNNKDE